MQSLFNKNGGSAFNSHIRNKEEGHGPDLRILAANSSRRQFEGQSSKQKRRESSADQQH